MLDSRKKINFKKRSIWRANI